MGKKDIFTSVVRVKGSNRFKVIPVKSSAEVEKELWIEMSKVVSKIGRASCRERVSSPV